MLIGFLAITAIAIGVVYMAIRSSGVTRKSIIDVVGTVDGRTVEVMINNAKERVILAGIGFPPGDHRSEQECAEVVREVVMGRRLYMEVHKEISGLKYVTLKSSNGDCLNGMMLSRGLARYESTGVGFIGELVEAENKARSAQLGIWDKNRALFRHLSNQIQADEAFVDSEFDEYAIDRD